MSSGAQMPGSRRFSLKVSENCRFLYSQSIGRRLPERQDGKCATSRKLFRDVQVRVSMKLSI